MTQWQICSSAYGRLKFLKSVTCYQMRKQTISKCFSTRLHTLLLIILEILSVLHDMHNGSPKEKMHASVSLLYLENVNSKSYYTSFIPFPVFSFILSSFFSEKSPSLFFFEIWYIFPLFGYEPCTDAGTLSKKCNFHNVTHSNYNSLSTASVAYYTPFAVVNRHVFMGNYTVFLVPSKTPSSRSKFLLLFWNRILFCFRA